MSTHDLSHFLRDVRRIRVLGLGSPCSYLLSPVQVNTTDLHAFTDLILTSRLSTRVHPICAQLQLRDSRPNSNYMGGCQN